LKAARPCEIWTDGHAIDHPRPGGARRDASRDCNALRLRRKFYGTGFVVFALVVLGTALAISFSDPAWAPVALVWAGSAILGTGALALRGYQGGKSAPYEKAGRGSLVERYEPCRRRR